MLMLVFVCSSGFAQGTRAQSGAIVVTELNSLLSTNGTTVRATATNGTTVNVQRLRDLLTQVQSSIYYYDGQAKTYGDVPTNLYLDLSSLNQIDSAITMKRNIEIATITINNASELNSTIDLRAFSNFPNLNYIYFISNVTTTSDVISRQLVNYDTRFNILYKIDKGDRNQ